MNHAIFVVKAIGEPVHLVYKGYETIEIKVQFPVLRQKDYMGGLTLLLWGDYRNDFLKYYKVCLLYTSPSPRDGLLSRMPSSA